MRSDRGSSIVRTLTRDCVLLCALIIGVHILSVTMDDINIETVIEQGTADEHDAEAQQGRHSCLYANVRGLRQAAGELAARADMLKPHLIILTECHIGKGEPINTLIPHGYKVVVKRWRTKHGGGLLILSQDHLLCDPIDTQKYFEEESSEIIAMQHADVIYSTVYTNKTSRCPRLIDALSRLRADRPNGKMVICGGFNAHNKEWLCSANATDAAGELVEDFAMENGSHQFIDFPTCGLNTLDLCHESTPFQLEFAVSSS